MRDAKNMDISAKSTKKPSKIERIFVPPEFYLSLDRLSDPLGYVEKEDIYKLLKAIGAIQRDYGDQSNRLHARMKYLIHDWGIDKFKVKVESYFAKPLKPFKKLPPWQYQDFLGWQEQGDGKLFLGISIENGRIQDPVFL